jgi:hypothetical protein
MYREITMYNQVELDRLSPSRLISKIFYLEQQSYSA